MKDKEATDGQFLIREESGRKTIILIRWILIIVVGYLVAFSSSGQSLLSLPYFLFVVYVLSNLLLMCTPTRWFKKDSFFATMIESYNRVRQGQELLKEDVRELEVLTDLTQSIGRNNNLSDFLIKVTQTLTEKLLLQRCLAILVDTQEKAARMVSSDDRAENDSIFIDLERYPALMESLLKNSGEISENRLLGNNTVSRYILKKIPILYQEKSMGTLYLRFKTLHRRLIRREEYFLSLLSQITATAIYNLEKSEI